MRIVENSAQFLEMLESSKRESFKSFGDDRMLLEKYLFKAKVIHRIFKIKSCPYVYKGFF